MSVETCACCGRALTPDEIGLTRRLVNRGAKRFWCITCLSVRYGVSEERLRVKIEDFRASGCTLFTPPKAPDRRD